MGTKNDGQNGYAVGNCSLGAVGVGYDGGRIVAVLLGDDEAGVIGQMQRRFPDVTSAGPCEDEHGVIEALASGTCGRMRTFPIKLSGTAFQMAVWSAIREIPSGQVLTYSQIAAQIGRPQAVRAVASACGTNPIAILVPCHRVVRGDGKASGYAWGVERKDALLATEGK